jgi:hypothetical protein
MVFIHFGGIGIQHLFQWDLLRSMMIYSITIYLWNSTCSRSTWCTRTNTLALQCGITFTSMVVKSERSWETWSNVNRTIMNFFMTCALTIFPI